MSEILGWFQQLHPWSVVIAAADILIVAYIIYRILLLLRGTGAAYMLIGLLAVAGVFLVARKLSLHTVSWLLDHVITYIILIVIIVFQADIRRGLMRMGRRLFLFWHPSIAAGDVEEVVEVCEQMARSRTGALIVFEREADLSQFIEQGMELEARVTPALLHNIFAPWPDNPLHDGGVVIKNNWIRQAAAVLPLSMNPRLDPVLGTRHRAAVGVTEETDAISVVVSEQRGQISLCAAGRIEMNLTPDELRVELLTRLSVPRSSRWVLLGRIVRRLEASLIRGGPAATPDGTRRPLRTEEILIESLEVDLRGGVREPTEKTSSTRREQPAGGADHAGRGGAP